LIYDNSAGSPGAISSPPVSEKRRDLGEHRRTESANAEQLRVARRAQLLARTDARVREPVYRPA
jgi:hypothetical protein